MQVKHAWYHFYGDGIMEIINFEICFCYELLVVVMRYSNHGINCVTSYKEHKFLFMVSASWERQSFFFLFFFSLEAILILLKFPVIHCIDIVEKLFIIQHLNFLPNPLKSWGMKISPIKLYAIIKKNCRPHYSINMTAVQVGLDFLNLPTDVFGVGDNKGTIIDSGTTLAYLPEMVYEPLVSKVCDVIEYIFWRSSVE